MSLSILMPVRSFGVNTQYCAAPPHGQPQPQRHAGPPRMLPRTRGGRPWLGDAAYLAAVALANFMFPYILLPTALNPMQLMIPPNDVEIPLVAEK